MSGTRPPQAVSFTIDKPVFGRLEVFADTNAEGIVRIDKKRRDRSKPVIHYLSDDTFALCGSREQAHAMLSKILSYSDKAMFTCVARLVTDAEKAVESTPRPALTQHEIHDSLHNDTSKTKSLPTSKLDGTVLSRRSLDAALKKWSDWGNPWYEAESACR
ncbi:uncharacterized protein ColSpa_00218 [Colletotrichum spaethianum]|uniref:Uncharacterized protein n=1 Tax=Colletotrichum spaethianum TaxID=700344 RepID=A0AA37L1B4_9PEZI|nr:uncharacterized protein ColSpa_00218 [Colletotrichum spaethianum]GKT40037.1 hypothetical protein ColSpa_00218 [Colletotrichum spaethianum]